MLFRRLVSYKSRSGFQLFLPSLRGEPLVFGGKSKPEANSQLSGQVGNSNEIRSGLPVT
jgi:hypothetical protein